MSGEISSGVRQEMTGGCRLSIKRDGGSLGPPPPHVSLISHEVAFTVLTPANARAGGSTSRPEWRGLYPNAGPTSTVIQGQPWAPDAETLDLGATVENASGRAAEGSDRMAWRERTSTVSHRLLPGAARILEQTQAGLLDRPIARRTRRRRGPPAQDGRGGHGGRRVPAAARAGDIRTEQLLVAPPAQDVSAEVCRGLRYRTRSPDTQLVTSGPARLTSTPRRRLSIPSPGPLDLRHTLTFHLFDGSRIFGAQD